MEFLVGHGDMMLLVVEVDLKRYNEQQKKHLFTSLSFFQKQRNGTFLGGGGGDNDR